MAPFPAKRKPGGQEVEFERERAALVEAATASHPDCVEHLVLTCVGAR